MEVSGRVDQVLDRYLALQKMGALALQDLQTAQGDYDRARVSIPRRRAWHVNALTDWPADRFLYKPQLWRRALGPGPRHSQYEVLEHSLAVPPSISNDGRRPL